jgi:hypothetical protein
MGRAVTIQALLRRAAEIKHIGIRRHRRHLWFLVEMVQTAQVQAWKLSGYYSTITLTVESHRVEISQFIQTPATTFRTLSTVTEDSPFPSTTHFAAWQSVVVPQHAKPLLEWLSSSTEDGPSIM